MQSSTSQNFDRIAPLYDALSFMVFGRRLQRAQVVWLNQIPAGASVLIVGGGSGWLLEQVLRHCRPRRVVYLEASAEMVARASRRMLRTGALGTVTFLVGDEHLLPAHEYFDVVITPFVLDLFTESTLKDSLIPRLLHVLKPTGLWLVTDFIQPGVWWQKTLLWTMIRFFRLTARIEAQHLADWQRLLAESGLKRLKQKKQVGGMVSAEVWMQQR